MEEGNTKREGLLRTPSRYAKALLDCTTGYTENVNAVVNGAIFDDANNGIVIVRDITIASMCEHHLAPFTGKVHIGYIPNGKVLGLSKLSRIAEVFARRLQLQERLSRKIAEAIEEFLAPKGIAVVLECTHTCMTIRGVQKPGAETITHFMIGELERDPEKRKQFYNLLDLGKKA
ncbi:GTP cyclohydrolase I [Calycina marina]|uniref:GTP cyclohydrolase 1 n=1 Tax=Calycina marina TaxID=1763456 RepID=A0A9P7Z485_9HELO|nr:GTP cyclohydrolase I [Calycina marina]